MFDLGACSYLNIAVAARVSCGSLRALKTLLESFVRADAQAVVEAQHAFRRASILIERSAIRLERRV